MSQELTFQNNGIMLRYFERAWWKTSSETQGQSVRGGRNGATKVFKNGRKNPWVPNLTGPFPNGFANTDSWLGRIIQGIFSAQSGAGIRKAVWKWSGETWYPGVLPPVLENFRRAISPASDWLPLGLRGWMKNAYSPKISISLPFGGEILLLTLCTNDSKKILLILSLFQTFIIKTKLNDLYGVIGA